MDRINSNQNSQTATDALALAVGAVMTTGQPTWPTREAPSYMVTRTAPSYSHFSNQVINVVKQHPHSGFAQEVAAIYASLSQRQVHLGEDFESAIYEDLDGLYEV